MALEAPAAPLADAIEKTPPLVTAVAIIGTAIDMPTSLIYSLVKTGIFSAIMKMD